MIADVCYCTTHSVQVGHLPSASERVWLAGLQGMGRIFNRYIMNSREFIYLRENGGRNLRSTGSTV